MSGKTGFEKLAERLAAADGVGVVFGVMPEAHPSGMPADELAAIHRRGTRDGKIPARDFMQVALDEVSVAGRRLLRQVSRDLLRGRSPRRTLEKLREVCEEAVVRAIDTFHTPPNAPATIRHKGRNDPLVNTGAMRDAAGAEIED